jgi:lauroyl/myristoyl acyltransferase
MPPREGTSPGYPSVLPRLVRSADLKLLLKLPLSLFLAAVVPERAWPDICNSIVRLSRRLHPGPAAREAAAIQEITRDAGFAGSAPVIQQGLQRNIRLNQLYYLASWKPGGWRADVRLEGREHLDRALAAGHGAILWVAPFVFADIVAKRALHEAGVRVHHLSSAGHGFSSTRLGIAVLNPIRTRIEDRYIAERITIPLDGAVAGAKEVISRCLEANAVVSIVLVPRGARCIEFPFHAGWLRMALGAASFALRTGAALLPVFSVRTGSRFVTTIEAALLPSLDLDREEAMRALGRAMANRVAEWVASYPDQFYWQLDALLRVRRQEPSVPTFAGRHHHAADQRT